MTHFEGFFELKTPPDLFQKLRREYDRLEKAPTDQDAAFNFFVTAEHLLDWLYPNDKKKRDTEREGNILLQVCSHIANGAKHFKATAKRHTSVKDTMVSAAAFQPNAFQENAFQVHGWLVIELDGEAAQMLGQNIEVVELARRLLRFWTDFFAPNQGKASS